MLKRFYVHTDPDGSRHAVNLNLVTTIYPYTWQNMGVQRHYVVFQFDKTEVKLHFADSNSRDIAFNQITEQ